MPSAPPQNTERDNKIFGLINAVQWISIFFVFNLFPKFGWGDLVFPAVIVIVGLHFFVMPPSYRYRANFVTGAALIVTAVSSLLLFKGDRMIAIAALCTGVVLMSSAAYALSFAARVIRLSALAPTI